MQKMSNPSKNSRSIASAAPVRPDRLTLLQSYSVDEVAEWLCKIGYHAYTGSFLDGGVNGRKLLNLKRSQLNTYFYGEERLASDFWNLLGTLKHIKNPASHEADFFERSRLRPSQKHIPPCPGIQDGRHFPHIHGGGSKVQAVDYQDDSFSDDDETYLDNPIEIQNSNFANRFTTSGLPGNPPIHPRLPPRLSEGPTVIDDQEDYLTFDSSGPERSQVFHPGQPARRPPAPFPVEDPPPRPPRSPAKRSPYDDHRPPLRPPQKYETDQPPERPPPPPPTQMSSTNLPQYPSSNNLPPYKERRGSDKSSSSHSPASSRPSSIKDQTIPFSHIPDRRNNYSTESSGSTSSEDLAKVSRPKSSTATSSKFVPKKQDKLVQNQFTKALSTHRQSLPFTSAMPGFESPPSPGRQDKPVPKLEPATTVEEQSYFKDMGRVDAQSLISSIKQDGVFIVRPRPESATKPYALTLWANNKFYNFLIRKRSDDKYALGNEKEDERSFHTVHSLIEFHQQNDLVLAEKEGSVKLTISPSFS